MKSFAEIDSSNIVLRVVIIKNETDEQALEWLSSRLGGTWVKAKNQDDPTSNHLINFAMVNGKWDSAKEQFIDEKPFDDWILNEETLKWHAPGFPDDSVYWDEQTESWVALN